MSVNPSPRDPAMNEPTDTAGHAASMSGMMLKSKCRLAVSVGGSASERLGDWPRQANAATRLPSMPPQTSPILPSKDIPGRMELRNFGTGVRVFTVTLRPNAWLQSPDPPVPRGERQRQMAGLGLVPEQRVGVSCCPGGRDEPVGRSLPGPAARPRHPRQIREQRDTQWIWLGRALITSTLHFIEPRQKK